MLFNPVYFAAVTGNEGQAMVPHGMEVATYVPVLLATVVPLGSFGSRPDAGYVLLLPPPGSCGRERVQLGQQYAWPMIPTLLWLHTIVLRPFCMGAFVLQIVLSRQASP